MTAPRELDSVRSTADTKSTFDDRTIPAGMTGAVLETWPDGSILVDFAFAPQTEDSGGDFVQGFLATGQYEVIQVLPSSLFEHPAAELSGDG